MEPEVANRNSFHYFWKWNMCIVSYVFEKFVLLLTEDDQGQP
jgi:hypothetical protein